MPAHTFNIPGDYQCAIHFWSDGSPPQHIWKPAPPSKLEGEALEVYRREYAVGLAKAYPHVRPCGEG